MKLADQLYQRFRQRIAGQQSGWREGEELPAETELARLEGVSRETLRQALKRLASDGWLRTTRSRRRQVCQPADVVASDERQPISKVLGQLAVMLGGVEPQDVERLCRLCPALREQLSGRRPGGSSWGESLRALKVKPEDEVLKAPAVVPCYKVEGDPLLDVEEVTSALNIRADDEVLWFRRLRSGDGTPLVIQTCIVPRLLLGSTVEVARQDLKPGGVTAAYEGHGIRRDFATVAFRARQASSDEAFHLRVGGDSPLMEERRTSYTLREVDGEQALLPYEYLLAVHSDRVRLRSGWSDHLAPHGAAPGPEAGRSASGNR